MGPDTRLQVSEWHGGRPSGRPLVVSECIGCGRVDRLRDCTGECRDVKVGLVRPGDPAASPVEAWLCAACGRIESPQPCLGVCVRQEVEMVPKDGAASVETPEPEGAGRADA